MTGKRPPSTPLRNIPREFQAVPPDREDVDSLPALGQETVSFTLSGLSLVLEGLDPGLARAISGRFGAYLCRPEDAPAPLRVKAHRAGLDYYVQPDLGESPEGYYRLRIVHGDGLIRMVTYSMAAWLDVTNRRGGFALGRGDFDPPERALENLCRVAVAWMAVARGGFLIHGASIVRKERAYVFFGKSASGKSTLCALSPEGRTISDDLSLVLPGPGGLVVAGTPFRGTYGEGEPVVGAYPLAAMFRLIQNSTTRVAAFPPMLAFAEYVANLPFVNDSLHAYPGLMDRLAKSIEGLPMHTLHFTRTPEFWGAVDAALAEPS